MKTPGIVTSSIRVITSSADLVMAGICYAPSLVFTDLANSVSLPLNPLTNLLGVMDVLEGGASPPPFRIYFHDAQP